MGSMCHIGIACDLLILTSWGCMQIQAIAFAPDDRYASFKNCLIRHAVVHGTYSSEIFFRVDSGIARGE